MIEVPTLSETKRGCGFREPGGLYLISDGEGEPCAKLPVRLETCPTCGHGIKPARAWTWIEPDALVNPEPHGDQHHRLLCPLSTGIERCGLLWIGGSFYTPASFLDEAERMGISRRIPAVPRDYEVGETWVFLAHREADWDPCPECGDGMPAPECESCQGAGKVPVQAVFHVFRPTRVEYVVKGDETEDELERLVQRGIRPVRIERIEDQGQLPETGGTE